MVESNFYLLFPSNFYLLFPSNFYLLFPSNLVNKSVKKLTRIKANPSPLFELLSHMWHFLFASHRGLVPLHNACSYGHYEVAELLVKVRFKKDTKV